MISTAATMLAHQGGWDEILLVLGPIAIVGGLLWLARRRVEHAAHAADPHDRGATPPNG